MAKKLFENQQSKLAARAGGKKEAGERLGLIVSHSQKLHPKSFRLRADDLERLSGIVAKLNEQCPGRTITEIDVIRGLFVMGTKATPERLLFAIREALL